MAVLDEVSHRRIPRSSATRWNFKSRIVQTVFELQNILVDCCTVLEDSSSESTGNGASGIKRMLNDTDILFWLDFFNKVMPHVDILYGQLQSVATNAAKAKTDLAAFTASIQKICDDFSVATLTGNESSSRKRRYAASASKVREAKEVCDTILFHCKGRFKSIAHIEASELLQLGKASKYTQAGHFPMTSLQNCIKAYPVLNEEQLKTELMLLYSRPDLYPT